MGITRVTPDVWTGNGERLTNIADPVAGTDGATKNYVDSLSSFGTISVADLNTTGNVVIAGNLTVNGTVTTVNTETINLADNIIVLNSNETGTPTQDAGIEVERGTSANKSFVWNVVVN